MIFLIYNIFIFTILFIVYLYSTIFFTLKFSHKRHKKFIWLLLIIHWIFSTAFYLFSLNFPSDANAYYQAALKSNDWFSLFGMGANFMRFITYPLVKLQFSYFNINLLFSIFGLFGFYNLYYLLIKNSHADNSKIYWGTSVLFLLPTFHFYTSGISKDNLLFFSITTLLTYIYFNKKTFYSYFLVLVLIFFIRSHVFLFLFLSYLIFIVFFNKTKMIMKFTIIIVCFSLLLFIVPIISTKLNVDVFSLNNVDKFFNRIQSFGTNKKFGGSIIDSSEMSVFQRMFSYSYLPLIWKSNTVLKHITSIENFLLLLIFIRFLFSNGKYKLFTKSETLIKISLIYSLISWFILSFTLYNLGLSVRQKYIYIPYLYFVIFVHLKNKRVINYRAK